MESLHQIFNIMHGFVMLGESALYQVMFAHEIMLAVMGALEYDPCREDGKKANYRDHLENTVVFKEVRLCTSNPSGLILFCLKFVIVWLFGILRLFVFCW